MRPVQRLKALWKALGEGAAGPVEHVLEAGSLLEQAPAERSGAHAELPGRGDRRGRAAASLLQEQGFQLGRDAPVARDPPEKGLGVALEERREVRVRLDERQRQEGPVEDDLVARSLEAERRPEEGLVSARVRRTPVAEANLARGERPARERSRRVDHLGDRALGVAAHAQTLGGVDEEREGRCFPLLAKIPPGGVAPDALVAGGLLQRIAQAGARHACETDDVVVAHAKARRHADGKPGIAQRAHRRLPERELRHEGDARLEAVRARRGQLDPPERRGVE